MLRLVVVALCDHRLTPDCSQGPARGAVGGVDAPPGYGTYAAVGAWIDSQLNDLQARALIWRFGVDLNHNDGRMWLRAARWNLSPSSTAHGDQGNTICGGSACPVEWIARVDDTIIIWYAFVLRSTNGISGP